MKPALTPKTAPSPGFGLGLRTPHYADFLVAKQPLDWLEIITDNFLVEGGKPLVMLERFRRDYPMAMHGVAMSLGAPLGPNLAYLKSVKALADRIQPLWVSDHVCWTGAGREQLHDLYPLPYTDEAVRHVIASIRRAQDVLQRRLVIENVSSYIEFHDSACSEWQFLSHIASEADCLLLVDVNNIYVSSVNHRFNPQDYLNGLPADRVQQIHLAGHSDHGDYIVDTHDQPVVASVWDLYRQACRRFGAVATMIERDANIPPLQELIQELSQARDIAQQEGASPTQVDSGSTQTGAMQATQSMAGEAEPLLDLQRAMSSYILSPAATDSDAMLPRLHAAQDVDLQQRLGIYHHGYRARLAEVLADCFAKTNLYMGSDVFEREAITFAVERPPLGGSLSSYGAGFPDFLLSRYPDNPELYELSRLDWDLRACFDGADVAAMDATSVAADVEQSWLALENTLHPSLRLWPVRTNVVQIWKAIDEDVEVPEVVRLDSQRTMAVWRKALQPHFRTLEPLEARFIFCLQDGQSILQACEQLPALLELADPQALGLWLREWWNDGWLRLGAADIAVVSQSSDDAVLQN